MVSNSNDDLNILKKLSLEVSSLSGKNVYFFVSGKMWSASFYVGGRTS